MKKIIVFILILLLLLIPITNISYGIDTGQYKNIYNNDPAESGIRNMGGQILGIVQVVAVAVGVIMLVVIGIKYMITSADEKAEIKKKLVPYVIGAVLVFGATGILTIIIGLVNEFNV